MIRTRTGISFKIETGNSFICLSPEVLQVLLSPLPDRCEELVKEYFLFD